MPNTARPTYETLQRLKEAAGIGGWSEDPSEIAPHLVEWRDRYRGTTPLLLKPDSISAISRIVEISAETRTALVPQGGNTGLVGGQIPNSDGTEILLSLKRLNRIRAIDPDASTLTAEAGCVLAAVQAHATVNQRLFPLSLASEGTATIGGLISTNAGGTGVLAYGNMRELVLGIEAVLPDGKVWNGLRALRKDNTGYDLKQLLIGAEGTLGVVTAAVLKLFPSPKAIESAIVAVPTVEHAIRLLRLAQSLGGTITAFELIPRVGLEFALKHISGTRAPLERAHEWLILMDVSIFGESQSGIAQHILTEAVHAGLIVDGVVSQSIAQRDAFWKIRDGLSEAQKYEGGSIKHDVSVPISAIAAFLDEATSVVQRAIPAARVVAFGHLGDGNIHFNVSQPVSAIEAEFLARLADINLLVHDLVHSFGGSISAEHGIGSSKIDELTRYKSLAELDAMRSIKRALDPHNIMNPGKVIRV